MPSKLFKMVPPCLNKDLFEPPRHFLTLYLYV
jgi:hypothetical protein